jgi:putative ABC transport system permease protein
MLLGNGVVQVYHRFFKFPELHFHPNWPMFGIAFTVSAGAALLGVIGAVLQAVRLPPAEAMRPEPPAEFRRSVVEKLGLSKFVSTTFRMALRNLERRPWQAFFTAFGLALATGIPIVPGAMGDGINYLLTVQWDVAERQNVTVNLIEPGSSTTLNDIRSLPGVMTAEPFRSVPARLRFGHHSRRLAVTGLPRDAYLNRLLDDKERAVELPPDGLLVSAKLAEILGAKIGDRIILEVQEGRRPTLEATIQGTITDYAGIGAYMEIGALRRLMHEGGTVSGAYLSVDTDRWDDFLKEVKGAPRIAGIGIKEAVRASFKKSTADMIGKITGIYFMFAIIVSFGVVYNSARIALSERSRDLATLRVIGFTRREVASVLISELAILTMAAIPVGMLIGSQLASAIVHTASTESVRLPLVLSPHTFAMAVIVVLCSSALSFAVVGLRLSKLDLLGVLKARE